jgi:hypothetical protein
MRRRLWVILGAATVLSLVACSGGGNQLPHGSTDGTELPPVDPDASHPVQTSDGGSSSETCAPNEMRDCVIDRGTFMGIHDCAAGKQTCGDDGFWGKCLEL